MKKPSITNLKRKLWNLCREIIGKRYPQSVCFTCGKNVEGKNRQLGHFIPSSVGGAILRYNLDNLRWQCYNCNINKSGNWVEFLFNLTEEIGKEKVDELMVLKRRIIKADRYFYVQMIEKYQAIVDKL